MVSSRIRALSLCAAFMLAAAVAACSSTPSNDKSTNDKTAPKAAEQLKKENSERFSIGIPKSATDEERMAWLRFQEIWSRIARYYYRVVDAKEIAEKLISGGLISLDPHTYVLSAEELKEVNTERAGEFGGIGAEVQLSREGVPGILVIAPLDDAPAARAGVKAQDVIVEIDGVSTIGMSLQKAVGLLRGPIGTSVTVTIIRKNTEKPLRLNIVRSTIHIRNFTYELKEGSVGYLKIRSFRSMGLSTEIADALKILKEKNGGRLSGVVIDLRNNPGGLLVEADQVANLFLNGNAFPTTREDEEARISPASVTISTERRGKIDDRWFVHVTGDAVEGIPVLVLINEGSASASEIVAKILQVFGRAIVAGESKSFGKGTVQSQFKLQTGGALMLTTGQYFIGPEGCEQAVQNEGVIPDVWLKKKEDSSVFIDESKYPNSIVTKKFSTAECRYEYRLPEGHREAAYKMLKALDLEIMEKDRAN